jgi:hypothetical protein
MSRIVSLLIVAGCSLQPPPAVDPNAGQSPEQAEQQAEVAMPKEGEPAQQSEDSAKLEMMMAEPDCAVEVVAVLDSSRAFWSDTRKFSCTYEVVINGQRYKYTRQLPKDRRREPPEVCEDGLDTTDDAVRDATNDCKDLQAGERPVTGLIPIR